jgi:hypothetical protein
MTRGEQVDAEAGDRGPSRGRIIVSEPAFTRHGGHASIECSIGEDRTLRISVTGPDDLIDNIRPDVTAFLPWPF